MRRALLLVCVAAGLGCEPGKPGGAVTVRDSAGVRIVESTEPMWAGQGWQLGDPLLEIDMGSPATAAGDATAGARLADGRIALRAGPSSIAWYSPDGALVRTRGGDAREAAFRNILSIERLTRDSLLVYDYGAHRLLVVNPDGSSTRQIPLPLLGRGAPPHRPHRLPDGTIIGAATHGPEPLATYESQVRVRDSMAVFRFRPQSGEVDSLAVFPHIELFVRIEGSTRGSIPFPFGRTSVLGVSGGDIIVGTAERPELRVLSHEGELKRIYRWSALPEPVTDADIEAYVGATRAALAGAPEDLRERTVGRVEAAGRPDQKAAYTSLRIDDGGNLWLGDAPLFGSPPRGWTILDADGRWLGRVELPADVRLLHIGRDFILAQWRLDGREIVRVHPLVKP